MGRFGEKEVIMIILLIIIFIWYKSLVKSSKREGNKVHEFDQAILNSETIVSHGFKKAQKFMEKKISLSYLTSCNWVLQNNDSDIQYTFRNNGDLLIIVKGIVQKCTYELIIDNNSILITKNDVTELYNIVNVQNDFLYLNRISNNEVLIFLNQTKIKDTVKQIAQSN